MQNMNIYEIRLISSILNFCTLFSDPTDAHLTNVPCKSKVVVYF